MTPIPDSYRSHGHTYRLIARKGMAAIYEMRVKGEPYQYEVVKIRARKAGKLHGKDVPASERLPSDEDWGAYGKTVMVAPGLPLDARNRAKALMEAWASPLLRNSFTAALAT